MNNHNGKQLLSCFLWAARNFPRQVSKTLLWTTNYEFKFLGSESSHNPVIIVLHRQSKPFTLIKLGFFHAASDTDRYNPLSLQPELNNRWWFIAFFLNSIELNNNQSSTSKCGWKWTNKNRFAIRYLNKPRSTNLSMNFCWMICLKSTTTSEFIAIFGSLKLHFRFLRSQKEIVMLENSIKVEKDKQKMHLEHIGKRDDLLMLLRLKLKRRDLCSRNWLLSIS